MRLSILPANEYQNLDTTFVGFLTVGTIARLHCFVQLLVYLMAPSEGSLRYIGLKLSTIV